MFLIWMCFYCYQDRITWWLIGSASAFNSEGSRIKSWDLGVEGRNFIVCFQPQKGPPGGDRNYK